MNSFTYRIYSYNISLGWYQCTYVIQNLAVLTRFSATQAHTPYHHGMLQRCFSTAKGLRMSGIIIRKCWGFLPKGKLLFGELEAQGAKENEWFLGCSLSSIFSRAYQNLFVVGSQLLLVLNKKERESRSYLTLYPKRISTGREWGPGTCCRSVDHLE